MTNRNQFKYRLQSRYLTRSLRNRKSLVSNISNEYYLAAGSKAVIELTDTQDVVDVFP